MNEEGNYSYFFILILFFSKVETRIISLYRMVLIFNEEGVWKKYKNDCFGRA